MKQKPLSSSATVFDRVEWAYHLGVELDNSVGNLVEGLLQILRGDLENAHWYLWCGKFSPTEPIELGGPPTVGPLVPDPWGLNE